MRAPATADFLRMPGNDTCFDCDASCAEDPNPNPNPNLNLTPTVTLTRCAEDRWCSVTYATALCIRCAGEHRALGVHRSFVRSLALDTLKPEEVRVTVGVRVRVRARARARVTVTASSSPSSRRRCVWMANPNADRDALLDPRILVALTLALTRCASCCSVRVRVRVSVSVRIRVRVRVGLNPNPSPNPNQTASP